MGVNYAGKIWQGAIVNFNVIVAKKVIVFESDFGKCL